jgi:hypothetical protein
MRVGEKEERKVVAAAMLNQRKIDTIPLPIILQVFEELAMCQMVTGQGNEQNSGALRGEAVAPLIIAPDDLNPIGYDHIGKRAFLGFPMTVSVLILEYRARDVHSHGTNISGIEEQHCGQ